MRPSCRRDGRRLRPQALTLRIHNCPLSRRLHPRPTPKDKERPFEFDPALPPLGARDMDRFRRAVFTEMCYLRDQGGHEVHITNGALVGRHAAVS